MRGRTEMGRDDDTITLSGTVKGMTGKAVKVLLDDYDDGPAWFPLSQCPDLEGADLDEEVEFECPEWLAEEKELV